MQSNERTVLPQVRYHPSIQTPAARPRTSPTTGPRPGSQHGDANTTRLKPVPEAKPHPGVKKPNKKTLPRAALHQDPAEKTDQISGRASPTTAKDPLDLTVPLDKLVVEEVEVLTRGQRTNQDWFSWRKNRITASVAHRIASCRFVLGKSKTPPTSYLAAITGDSPSVQTRAMRWGIEKEAEAVRAYQKLKSLALGEPVKVEECGLFVDAQQPWLAASPDGIVTDSRTGTRLCLEVKCPYKHRDRRVEDACRGDPAFCLEIQDQPPGYRLKTSHSYFTQIQCQLAVTGLQRADLVVYTTKETAIVPVTFDPVLWAEIVSKLEGFYRGAVLPHLREKRRERAAAGTPEL